jgi:hypothetical protein
VVPVTSSRKGPCDKVPTSRSPRQGPCDEDPLTRSRTACGMHPIIQLPTQQTKALCAKKVPGCIISNDPPPLQMSVGHRGTACLGEGPFKRIVQWGLGEGPCRGTLQIRLLTVSRGRTDFPSAGMRRRRVSSGGDAFQVAETRQVVVPRFKCRRVSSGDGGDTASDGTRALTPERYSPQTGFPQPPSAPWPRTQSPRRRCLRGRRGFLSAFFHFQHNALFKRALQRHGLSTPRASHATRLPRACRAPTQAHLARTTAC